MADPTFQNTAFQAAIAPNQTLHLTSAGTVTSVTLHSATPGSQQQSSSQFSTGSWIAPPQLYRLTHSYIAVITTDHSPCYLYIQGNQLQMSNQPPEPAVASQLATAQPQPMQPVSNQPTPMADLPPMQMPPLQAQPMQPMQPLPPMTMTMGNMTMSTADMNSSDIRTTTSTHTATSTHPQKTNPTSQPTSETKKFCSQCGTAVTPQANFCSNCGHQL